MSSTLLDLFWEAKSKGVYLAISAREKKIQYNGMVLDTPVQDNNGWNMFYSVDPSLKPLECSWSFLQRLCNACMQGHNLQVEVFQFMYKGYIPIVSTRSPYNCFDVHQTLDGLVTVVLLPNNHDYFRILGCYLPFGICVELLQFVDSFLRCSSCNKNVAYECKVCNSGAHNSDSLCHKCEITCSVCDSAQGDVDMDCISCQRRCHAACAAKDPNLVSDQDQHVYVCTCCSDQFIWCDGCKVICKSEASFRCGTCNELLCKNHEQCKEDCCERCYLETKCDNCLECHRVCDQRKKDHWMCSECEHDWHYRCKLPHKQDDFEAICYTCFFKRKKTRKAAKKRVLDAGFVWNKLLCHEFRCGNETFTDICLKYNILHEMQQNGIMTWNAVSEQLWRDHKSHSIIVHGMQMRDRICRALKTVGLKDENLQVDLATVRDSDIENIIQERCEHKLVHEYVNWKLLISPSGEMQFGNLQQAAALRFLESIGQRFTKPWIEDVTVEEWREQWQQPKDPKRRKKSQQELE